MEKQQLLGEALAYYKAPDGFAKDLLYLISHCDFDTEFGFCFVSCARDISHLRITNSDDHEVFFRTFWCYTHSIVHQMGNELMRDFCRLSGYPMFSLGLGGVMSAKQTMYEFKAFSGLNPSQLQEFKDVVELTSDYFQKELMIFLDGRQPELVSSSDYQTFVAKIQDKKQNICDRMVAEMDELLEYWEIRVDRKDDRLQIAIDNQNLELVKVDWEDSMNPFFISTIPITESIWNKINCSEGLGCDSKLPKTDVTKKEVEKFLMSLSLRTKLTFRLPTLKEWQWAAKGGKKSQGYSLIGGNNVDEIAWYKGNSNGEKHPAALKKPNELGLYDMAGNVWEMTSDEAEDYFRLLMLMNPQDQGIKKIVGVDCGGCYFDDIQYFVPNASGHFPLDGSSRLLGFRVVCEIGSNE